MTEVMTEVATVVSGAEVTETATKNVLCEEEKSRSRFPISSKRVKQIFYGAIIFIASIQILAVLSQIVHLYQYLQPEMSLDHRFGVLYTLWKFPKSVFSLILYAVIVKKKILGKFWHRINRTLPDYSIRARSMVFIAAWGVLLAINGLGEWLLVEGMELKTILGQVAWLWVEVTLALNFMKFYEMRKNRSRFFLNGIILVAACLIAIEVGIPTLLSMVFPKIERTPQNEPIFELAKRVNFDPNHILEYKEFNNAGFLGTLFSEYIILGDGVAKNDHMVAVMAHELGHRAHYDSIKALASVVLGMTLWIVALFCVIAPSTELYEMFGFETEPIIAAFAIKGVFQGVSSIFVSPIFNTLGIFQEYNADAYAVGLSPEYGEKLIGFFKSLDVNSTATKLFEYVFLTHPTMDHRVEAIKSLMAK